MSIQPLYRFGALNSQTRPRLNGDSEFEMAGHRVLDTCKHAPEHHAQTCVTQMQEARKNVAVVVFELQVRRQARYEGLQFFLQVLKSRVGCVYEARGTRDE